MTQHLFSWIAVRGVAPSRVREVLALAETGRMSVRPRAEYNGAELAGGWYLIFSPRFDYADHTPLAELSQGGELVTCCVNEALMYSSVSGWRDGARQWYFVHDGDIGIQHMHLDGDAPPEFHEVANRLNVVYAEGAGIDITVDHVFEIPAQTAQRLTGFHHEDVPPEGEQPFEELARVS